MVDAAPRDLGPGAHEAIARRRRSFQPRSSADRHERAGGFSHDETLSGEVCEMAEGPDDQYPLTP